MLFLTSFYMSASSLFDFDLTFVIEIILFLLLSYNVTNLFLIPISDQLNSRADFINYTLKKTCLLFAFGNDSLKNLVSLVVKEENENNRQKRIIDQRVGDLFETEALRMQNKANNVLIEFKKSIAIKFAFLFSSFENNLINLINEFFHKKFNLN
jgi:hypothetical protein